MSTQQMAERAAGGEREDGEMEAGGGREGRREEPGWRRAADSPGATQKPLPVPAAFRT